MVTVQGMVVVAARWTQGNFPELGPESPRAKRKNARKERPPLPLQGSQDEHITLNGTWKAMTSQPPASAVS